MTTITPAITTDSALVERAEAVAATAHDASGETHSLRRPADRVIEALENAGLTRMALPTERGGSHVTMTAQAEVLAAIAEGDASVSWVTSVYNAVGHMLVGFSDQALDKVLTSANPKPSGVFALAGTSVKVDGGYRITGRWPFASGQHHAGWIIVPTIHEDMSNGPLGFVVPKSEFTVEDDWHVSGFVGTGSNAVSLNDVFVPEHRMTPFMAIVSGQYSSSYANDPYYAQPFVPIMCAISVGTPVGLARAALKLFHKKIENRAITYTNHTDQKAAALTHLQLAEAQTKLDQAEFHMRRLTTTVDEHIASNLPWDITTRVRCRADVAEALKLSRQVCEIVEHASGASSIHTSADLPRILRDVRAISVHAFLLHSTNAELYGKVLAGLDPEVPFV